MEAQDGALAEGLRPGAIVVDMSSADPVGTRALGAELARRDIALVDAPVSGGVPRADGTLAIMIGGDAATVAAVKPVLAAMGRNLFEVGTLGCGHAMKALNNYLAGAAKAAACEAIAIGRRFGLDPAVMTDVINASTGRSFVSEQPDQAARAERRLRHRLRARAAGEGRRHRRRSRAGRSTSTRRCCGSCAARWDEARDALGGAAGPFARLAALAAGQTG